MKVPLTVLAMKMAGTSFGVGATEIILELMDRIPDFDDEVKRTFKVKTNPVVKWLAACNAHGSWVDLDIGATNFETIKTMAIKTISTLAENYVPSEGTDSDDSNSPTPKNKKRTRAPSTSTQEEWRESRGPAPNIVRLAATAKACTSLVFLKGKWSSISPDRATAEGREFITLLTTGAAYRFLGESQKVGAQALLELILADTIAYPWLVHALENLQRGAPCLFAAEIVECAPARASILRALAPLIVGVWLRLEPHGSAPEMPVSVALHLAALPLTQLKGTTKERYKTLMVSDFWVNWVKPLKEKYPDWYPNAVNATAVSIPVPVLTSSSGLRGGGGGGLRGDGGRGGGGGGFRGGRGGGMVCFRCQEPGHKAWECPKKGP